MTSIVIDKSFLQGASRAEISTAAAFWDFVLGRTLLHELSSVEEPFLDRSVENLAFLNSLGCTRLPDLWEIVTYELSNGYSARRINRYPLMASKSELVSRARACRPEATEFESICGYMHNATCGCEDDGAFSDLRRLKEQEFYEWLSNSVNDGVTGETVLAHWAAQAGRFNVQVAPALHPDRTWFLYGGHLACLASVIYKLYKAGDGVLDPKKPANLHFDAEYLGLMALADGLACQDHGMLKLAWAIWPEKRGHLYTYEERKIRRFCPKWK